MASLHLDEEEEDDSFADDHGDRGTESWMESENNETTQTSDEIMDVSEKTNEKTTIAPPQEVMTTKVCF